jgi:PadR family transcriptional regulator AphA
MPLINKTKYALLGMLSKSSFSGYDLRKGIESNIGHFWHESYGQIYPILRQLVTEGLATSQTETLPGRPNRIVYTITSKGQDVLHCWLRESTEGLPVERNEFLLKLFFGHEVPRDVSIHHIQEHHQLAKDLLRTYYDIQTLLEAHHSASPNYPFWLGTLRYGIIQAEAVVEWCQETLDRLSQS